MRKILIALAFFILAPVVVDARSYDFYVDEDNDTGTEDGSNDHPYDTIGEAIEAAENNDEDDREIYVKDGEYREQVHLEDGMELYGKSKSGTIILGRSSSGKDYSYAVKMEDNTKIKNFTVKYGKIGIWVTKNSKAKIEDCKIKKSDDIGVKVDKANRTDKEKFTMEDTKVYDGDGKAMYIRKRKVEIEGNEIYDNEEEGIDLRASVKGKIQDNEIYNNGESGIELEARGANLKITDNTIKSNDSSGITAQYRSNTKAGQVVLEDNTIKNNDEFGLGCANPQGGSPVVNYFKNMYTLIKNKITGNDSGVSSSMCGL